MITQGTVADCTQAAALMAGFRAEHLLADRGYDTHSVIAQGKAQKMKGGDSTQKDTQTDTFL